MNVNGGAVGIFFEAESGSVVNVSAGSVGRNFKASSGSEVNISGGVIGDSFESHSDSVVNIDGVSFLIDGVPLDTLASGDSHTIVDRDVTLSGRLADGLEFSFELNSTRRTGHDFFSPTATLNVTLVTSDLPGDYNNDGVVDAADYSVWRDGEGKAIALINETVTPSQVTIEDYNVWLANYGATLPPAASVPEPSAWGLTLLAGAWGVRSRGRRA